MSNPEISQGPGSIAVQSHLRPHLSDIFAEYLLVHYGGGKYGKGAEISGPRVVMVGRGGYDEHNPENLPDPNAEECEATLVARDFGIRNLPELSFILDYTLDVDRRGKRKGFLKLGLLVEHLYDAYPQEEEWRVKHWASLVIVASIEAGRAVVEQRERPPVDRRMVVYFLRRAYAKVHREFTRFEFAQAARRRLFRGLAGWFKGQFEYEPFGLPHCISLLWRYHFGYHRWGERWMVEWVADAFRAELMRRLKFLRALAEAGAKVERDGEVQEALLTVSGEELVALLLHSDNPEIYKALFSEEFSASGEERLVDIAAVRRSNGNAQIYRRLHGSRKRKMYFVVALLRDCERRKRGYTEPASWAELIAPNGPKGAECWFFYEPTHGIFNGRWPDEPAESTVLTDEEIIDCIARGLDDEYGEFRRQFYLERSGKAA